MAFAPLNRIPVSQQIVAQLREAITAGQYAAGQAMPSERELVTLFGASRAAVREAMFTLQAQGWVERAHGRAARVAPTSAVVPPVTEDVLQLPDSSSDLVVRDVKQLRMVLEVELVRLAALAIDATGMASLRAALQANREAISDSARFLQTDMALHSEIARLSGNALMVAMSRKLLDWLARRRVDMVHVEGSDMLSYREHAGIAERIMARDPDGAARAMADHLSRSHLAYGRLHSQQAGELVAGEGLAIHPQVASPVAQEADAAAQAALAAQVARR